MSRFTLLLCLFGLVLSQVFAAWDAEAIIGGVDDVNMEQFGYQVSLQLLGRNLCGGCIIGSKHVLTAAGCVTDNDGQLHDMPYRVVAGTNDLTERPPTFVDIPVHVIYIHSGFNRENHLYDIAILKLAGTLDLKYNSNITHLFPVPESLTDHNTVFYVSGFGYHFSSSRQWNMVFDYRYGKLRVSTVRVLSDDECASIIGTRPHTSIFCGQMFQNPSNPGEGVCTGDIGGPLVNGGTVVGIISVPALDCNEFNRAARYTRVSEYWGWIYNICHGSLYDYRSITL